MRLLNHLVILMMAIISNGREAARTVPAETPRYIMYLTGYVLHSFTSSLLHRKSNVAHRQHPEVPPPILASRITHINLAFVNSNIFNDDNVTSYPLFTTVEKVRTQFATNMKVLIAVGGWGDTEGFETAAMTKKSRQKWAKGVANMVERLGADGESLQHYLFPVGL